MVYNPITSEQQRKQQANLERRNQRDAAWTKFKVGMADSLMGIPFKMAETGGTELVKRKMAGAFPTVAEEGQRAQNVHQGVLTDNLRALSGAMGATGAPERQARIKALGGHIETGTAPEDWEPTSAAYRNMEEGIGGIEQPIVDKWIQERDAILARQEMPMPAADADIPAWHAAWDKDTARLQELEGWIGAMQGTIADKRQKGRMGELQREHDRLKKEEGVFLERFPELVQGINPGMGITGVHQETQDARRRARRAASTRPVPTGLVADMNAARKAFAENPTRANGRALEEVINRYDAYEAEGGGKIPRVASTAASDALEEIKMASGAMKASRMLKDAGVTASPKLLVRLSNSPDAVQLLMEPRYRPIRELVGGGLLVDGLARAGAQNMPILKEFLDDWVNLDAKAQRKRRLMRSIIR
tara:strand:- start:6423 stop:7676 length:1254 start_codon:yes stop_codon:yes gene_type:complete